MKPADEHLDVLQNLEATVAEIWRAHPEMTDYAALHAYEAAFQFYRAELRGRTPKTPPLTGLEATAFEAVKAMCDFRLGRAGGAETVPEEVPPVPLDKMLECLRELSKSVERHTKVGGRQGYLEFIDHFV